MLESYRETDFSVNLFLFRKLQTCLVENEFKNIILMFGNHMHSAQDLNEIPADCSTHVMEDEQNKKKNDCKPEIAYSLYIDVILDIISFQHPIQDSIFLWNTFLFQDEAHNMHHCMFLNLRHMFSVQPL